MKKKKSLAWLSVIVVSILLVGCTVSPDPANLNFGKVYVGMTKMLSARWVNRDQKKDAVLLGITTKVPYSASGTFAGTLAPGQSTGPIDVTFAPTAPGSFSEEVRPAATGVAAILLQLNGEGVWAINEGNFLLENLPPSIIGSLDLSAYPIQPGQPIDWGTRRLGGPEVTSDFLVRNQAATDVNGTANASLLRGNQHFSITFPAAFTGMNIGPTSPTTLGTRRIQVTFKPEELGTFWDVVEITDTANPASRAGIVLKARVTETGE